VLLGFRLAVLLLAAALAFACKREHDDGRAPAEAQPTAAQQEGRSPAEGPSAPEPSQRANRQRRAAARASTVRHVAGTLERRSMERVVIRGPGEERVTLRIARATEITLDGRPATLEALREGSAVRAAYESGRGERPTALSIEGRSSDERRERRAPDATWVPNTGERGGG
jgi:hypothetical protein